jgi:hypothetical protein
MVEFLSSTIVLTQGRRNILHGQVSMCPFAIKNSAQSSRDRSRPVRAGVINSESNNNKIRFRDFCFLIKRSIFIASPSLFETSKTVFNNQSFALPVYLSAVFERCCSKRFHGSEE